MRKTTLGLMIAFIVGLTSLWFGYRQFLWQDQQTLLYNAGLAAYESAQEARDMKTAVELFDRSIAIYKQRTASSTWLERFLYPAPSRELAALAYFHKAKALLHLKQGEPAVNAFKESLKLNPGNDYAKLHGFEHVSKTDISRLEWQAYQVKYDLDMLFKNNPQLAQGQGKGQGKKGDQKGEAKKQMPGQQPGDQAGKGKKDEL